MLQRVNLFKKKDLKSFFPPESYTTVTVFTVKKASGFRVFWEPRLSYKCSWYYCTMCLKTLGWSGSEGTKESCCPSFLTSSLSNTFFQQRESEADHSSHPPLPPPLPTCFTPSWDLLPLPPPCEYYPHMSLCLYKEFDLCTVFVKRLYSTVFTHSEFLTLEFHGFFQLCKKLQHETYFVSVFLMHSWGFPFCG